MDIKKYLEECKNLVEEHIEHAFHTPAVASTLLESMEYSLDAGGKRVRPALAFAACEAVGGDRELAIPAAVALEMIHTYSLIHDDLPAMDDDDLRRGKPTNHKVYGDAIAILAGDGLLTQAFYSLSSPTWKITREQQVDIIRIIAEGSGCEGMVGGQVLDLQNENKDFDEKTLEAIHKHKTGKLLLASILAGGRAGGATGKNFERLKIYGESIGLAFQIADDILDLTATTAELGKDSKSDLKKKKATYPSLLGIEESKRKAQNLLNQALDAIAPFGKNAEALQAIARFIVERRS